MRDKYSIGGASALAERVGHDIVTSDGTSLLGADDKARSRRDHGRRRLSRAEPGAPAGPDRIAFTVDEEVGRGAEDFDLDSFGADVAYTLDGSGLGELEIETFSAMSMRVTIRGLSVHPGSSRKARQRGQARVRVRHVASARQPLARDDRGPRGDSSIPCASAGARRGDRRPHARDHDDELLARHMSLLRELAQRVVAREPRAHVDIEERTTYRTCAPRSRRTRESWTRSRRSGVRGSSQAGDHPRRDGRLLLSAPVCRPRTSSRGPEYHSVREWASVQDMAAAAATIVEARLGLGRIAGVSPGPDSETLPLRCAGGQARRDKPPRRRSRRPRRGDRILRADLRRRRATRPGGEHGLPRHGDQFVALEQVGRPVSAGHIGLVVDDRRRRSGAREAGAEIVGGHDVRDPWGNRWQIVDYREIQFTKTPRVLEGMSLGGLGEVRACPR